MLGKILRQRYKIIKKIGAGGFGETYLAQDLDLPPHPLCAVKRLLPKMLHPDNERLFQQEAQILYKLGQQSDQIPQLFAYFQEQGEFYLVQEFIQGSDLSREIIPGRKLEEDFVIEFLRELLSVLAVVHENNVIHRDIKPANIMRSILNGKLVLIDFGVVKEISSRVVNPLGVASFTVAVGTPGYMPSEQAFGKPRLSSDVYAAGMTAIQALTGLEPDRIPEDHNGEVQWRNLVNVSDWFADILTKMVRYHFSERYQSAQVALEALTQPIGVIKPLKIGSQSGYINSLGYLIIQPKFDDAGQFFVSESQPLDTELAWVRIDAKYGYIDKRGRMIIHPQFDETWGFSEGLAAVRLGYKCGYIDSKGQLVILPKFDETWRFSEGLAAVKIGKKWGYIDRTGQFVIPPQFEDGMFGLGHSNFSEGLAAIQLENQYGYIDHSGKIVIQLESSYDEFESPSRFSQGLAGVKMGQKWGYIDQQGRVIIAPQFDQVGVFAEGLAKVMSGGKAGYIDRRGVLVIPYQFDWADRFSEGMARVRLGAKSGYIDQKGGFAIPPRFDDAWSFSDGMARVEIGGQERYIDRIGRFIY